LASFPTDLCTFIPPTYLSVQQFTGGFSGVMIGENNYAFIDRKGTFWILPLLSQIISIYFYLDKNGEILFEFLEFAFHF
jgi:hypothetical protein